MTTLAEPPMTSTLLAIAATGLGKVIDDRPILRDITLEIPAGALVALMGANGAGKSTLLKIFSTLTAPSSGDLLLFGEPSSKDGSRLRRRIGLIGHQSMLYRDLSARENLEFFGKFYGISNPASRAQTLLDAVGLADRADDPIKAFSRGMTQRVAIARALVHNPDLLLADEPFDGLDAPSAQVLEELLSDLHQAGKTIIVANHDIDQSLRLAPRAVVLHRGEVVLDQPTADLTRKAVLDEMERP